MQEVPWDFSCREVHPDSSTETPQSLYSAIPTKDKKLEPEIPGDSPELPAPAQGHG